jgi:hypothetical protein
MPRFKVGAKEGRHFEAFKRGECRALRLYRRGAAEKAQPPRGARRNARLHRRRGDAFAPDQEIAVLAREPAAAEFHRHGEEHRLRIIGGGRGEGALGHPHGQTHAARQTIVNVTPRQTGCVAGERADENLQRFGAEQKIFRIVEPGRGLVGHLPTAQAVENATQCHPRSFRRPRWSRGGRACSGADVSAIPSKAFKSERCTAALKEVLKDSGKPRTASWSDT